MKLECGDCFDLFQSIESGSIDLLLTDPPYGITACDWDVKPDIPRFFQEAWRVLKPNGAAVIFGTVKSGLDWIMASRKEFRYDLVWNKRNPAGFLDANRKPLRVHEMVFVFYRKLPVFNPQFRNGKPYKKIQNNPNLNHNYGKYKTRSTSSPDGLRFPISIIEQSTTHRTFAEHSTQKPVELMEWLIKTYSNEGETVLDPFMGSGSTGVACIQTGRDFIGIEKEEKFFEIAKTRIEQTQEQNESQLVLELK